MVQGAHFPGHCAQEQLNPSTITLIKWQSPCQEGITGSRAPLDPPKMLDPWQERRTPSETSGSHKKSWGVHFLVTLRRPIRKRMKEVK